MMKTIAKYIRRFIKNEDVVIESAKMNYLLRKANINDKSDFLCDLGYSHNDINKLINDIRWHTGFETSKFKTISEFTFNIMAKTTLNGKIVTTGWQIKRDGTVRFFCVDTRRRQNMEIKMGDCITTTTEKTVNWGDEKILIPKGTGGLVCEVYTEGAILAEVGDNKKLPWILATFYDGEYKKND